ncbi:hypothetical protein IFR05_003368 [Cadophora sp. M221]|nr:hypothetical protein IFR05_003368 [Cadophora sp. M221]
MAMGFNHDFADVEGTKWDMKAVEKAFAPEHATNEQDPDEEPALEPDQPSEPPVEETPALDLSPNPVIDAEPEL